MDLDGHHLIYCCDRPVFTCQCTICQFTGLHDKNGREIYEGDILRSVRFTDILIMVVYDEGEAAFMSVQINKNIGTDLETRCHITQDWINRHPKVVIGNIYDNKELLNEWAMNNKNRCIDCQMFERMIAMANHVRRTSYCTIGMYVQVNLLLAKTLNQQRH